jgi:hypothetical protein
MLALSGVSARAVVFTAVPAIQQPQQAPNQAQPRPDPIQAQPAQEQPKPDQAQSSTFTGTIVKDGEQFLLKDSTGAMYKLDDSSRAQSFEGKSVKVTGKLDTDAKLIHVDNIEALAV